MGFSPTAPPSGPRLLPARQATSLRRLRPQAAEAALLGGAFAGGLRRSDVAWA